MPGNLRAAFRALGGKRNVGIKPIAEAMPAKITDQVEQWYDSKEWQDILKLVKLQVSKNGLELLLAILRRMNESKTKKTATRKQKKPKLREYLG